MSCQFIPAVLKIVSHFNTRYCVKVRNPSIVKILLGNRWNCSRIPYSASSRSNSGGFIVISAMCTVHSAMKSHFPRSFSANKQTSKHSLTSRHRFYFGKRSFNRGRLAPTVTDCPDNVQQPTIGTLRGASRTEPG